VQLIRFWKKLTKTYVEVSQDNPLPVSMEGSTISVNVGGVSIQDPTTPANQQKVNSDGSTNTVTTLTGSFVRLSTEPKPTTGVQDGNDLLEVDTGKVFVYYSGTWREI
jgi:hypothetical protein